MAEKQLGVICPPLSLPPSDPHPGIVQAHGSQNPQGQQQPLILHIPLPRRNAITTYDAYDSRNSQILGIIQIVGAIVAIGLNAAGIWIHTEIVKQMQYSFVNESVLMEIKNQDWTSNRYVYYVALCLWCVIFFGLSGTFAICAAKKRTKSLVISHTVLAMMAVLEASLIIYLSCDALKRDAIILQDLSDKALVRGSQSISIFWILTCLVGVFVCSWSSSLGCRVACCVNNNDVTETTVVQYHEGQAVIIDNSRNPPRGAIQTSSYNPIPQTDVTAQNATNSQLEAVHMAPKEEYVDAPPPYVA